MLARSRNCRHRLFKVRGSLVNNGFQRAFKNVDVARAEYRAHGIRDTDKSPDSRENRENDQRDRHTYRRFMRVKICRQSMMFVILVLDRYPMMRLVVLRIA